MKNNYSSYFPKNHTTLLKEDKKYPYTVSVPFNLNTKSVRFNMAVEIEGQKSFLIEIPTEYALILEEAHRLVAIALEKYCRKNNYSINSSQRHRRMMELEIAYYKPIHERYGNE